MFKKSLVVFVAISLIATGIFAFWQPLYNLRTKIFGDDVKVTGGGFFILK